ncbi:MAG: UDP-glucose 4-epimerase [Chloroflexi bacterium]|nr:MAG: UDP-glucose 4-epimerase [Chloroflexota bacterium]
MPKTVVTGGAGFIGSHIGEALAKAGHQVVLIDNLDDYYSPDHKRRNVACVLAAPGASFVKADVTDLGAMREIISRDVDYVFHEAAQPGVRFSVKDPFKPNNVNVIGTLNVLQASLEAGVKRVVNASSSSVYGKAEYLPFDEGHPTQPISPYGVSKLAAEHYCRVFHEVYGISVVSLRYFSVYGPRMRPDLAISLFTRKLMNNEVIQVFGDGTQTRDFTHIDDIVKANMKLLTVDKADGKAINVGAGNAISVNDLVRHLGEIIGVKPEVAYIGKQKGETEHTLADCGLGQRLIGFTPDIDIRTGLEAFVRWQRDNLTG